MPKEILGARLLWSQNCKKKQKNKSKNAFQFNGQNT